MAEQLYVLDDTSSDYHQYAGGQVINEEAESRCPECNVFVRSTEPLKIALNHLGRQGFAEHLWNSHLFPIFRQDLVDIWQNAGLTGFDTRKVVITGWYRKTKKPLPETIPNYYELLTTSKVKLIEPPPVGVPCQRCGYQRYGFSKHNEPLPRGIEIDRATWDGADFFGFLRYKHVLCTEKVVRVTLQKEYKNIVFVRLSDYGTWEGYDYRKWTPREYESYRERFYIRKLTDL